ncbi:MAG: hypothetical protein LBT27_03055 [Prevotellaceae bacterium]|jgi:hypothetical protein|nr:hypothetical protein [Prevotellaceae bacterium]
MNYHNFTESLLREQNYHNHADDFYTKHLGATNIVRYNRNTNDDMTMQRADIDVSFTHKSKIINISEKFRAKDFNDLYIEFYSKFPNVRGWLDKSQADYITYFFPTRVFLIDEKKLSEFYKNQLSPTFSEDIFRNLIEQNPNNNAQKQHYIKLQNNKYRVRIIQAYNKTQDAAWYTMGIAIPFNVLADFGIYCREFSF